MFCLPGPRSAATKSASSTRAGGEGGQPPGILLRRCCGRISHKFASRASGHSVFAAIDADFACTELRDQERGSKHGNVLGKHGLLDVRHGGIVQLPVRMHHMLNAFRRREDDAIHLFTTERTFDAIAQGELRDLGLDQKVVLEAMVEKLASALA